MSQKEEEKPDSTAQRTDEEQQSSGTYEAGCHCGYIRFSVTLTPALPEIKVMNCNCSACTRFGYLLVCKLLPLTNISHLMLLLGQGKWRDWALIKTI